MLDKKRCDNLILNTLESLKSKIENIYEKYGSKKNILKKKLNPYIQKTNLVIDKNDPNNSYNQLISYIDKEIKKYYMINSGSIDHNIATNLLIFLEISQFKSYFVINKNYKDIVKELIEHKYDYIEDFVENTNTNSATKSLMKYLLENPIKIIDIDESEISKNTILQKFIFELIAKESERAALNQNERMLKYYRQIKSNIRELLKVKTKSNFSFLPEDEKF